jgi:antitoxin component HigA of HigAB toxin-antitoxin module
MRPIKNDENYIDVVDKIKSYLTTEEDVLVNFTDISNDVIKSLDIMEKYANGVPDNEYRKSLSQNIHMMRIYLIQIIDTIDELNNIGQ